MWSGPSSGFDHWCDILIFWYVKGVVNVYLDFQSSIYHTKNEREDHEEHHKVHHFFESQIQHSDEEAELFEYLDEVQGLGDRLKYAEHFQSYNYLVIGFSEVVGPNIEIKQYAVKDELWSIDPVHSTLQIIESEVPHLPQFDNEQPRLSK